MRLIINKLYMLCLVAVILLATGCNDENESGLRLDCDVTVESFSLGDYKGTIDQVGGTITIQVPDGTDVSKMIPAYTLSDGATTDLPLAKPADFTLPVTMTILNGDVYRKYTVSVKVDEANILSFKINNVYIGVINQKDKTVTVYVPIDMDVTRLTAAYTLTNSASATPENNSLLDFTHPVKFTVKNRTATSEYMITVIPTDMKYTAFIGTAATIDEIVSLEEKAAAEWMVQNVSAAEYISFTDVANGSVQLGKYAVVWWHWHVDGYSDATGLPTAATASVEAFKQYYMNGGNLLLTRYATRYLEPIEITLDKRSPNNCWGGNEATPEEVTTPWGVSFKGHTDHPLFKGLQTASGKNYIAYLFDTGYKATNSTAQWHIGSDWGGYATKQAWESSTGGIALGRSNGDADKEDGAIVMAEFPKRGATGKVITIGSGAYDWYSVGVTMADNYRSNLSIMTQNAINYLGE